MPRQAPPQSLEELVLRARALEQQSVGALATALEQALPATSRRGKGFVGQLVELALGADPEAYDRPDFLRLGVELKTIPVDPTGRPRESTFCCSIRMAEADAAVWQGSRLQRRLACVLWMPVHTERGQPISERVFGKAQLWHPSAATQRVLQADWEQLMGMLGAGQAPRLSAHLGQILQVRPKGANSRQRTLGVDADGPVAVAPMGFYLRPGFTARLLAGESDV
jgi:DNA mismatch repair protein MutH